MRLTCGVCRGEYAVAAGAPPPVLARAVAVFVAAHSAHERFEVAAEVPAAE